MTSKTRIVIVGGGFGGAYCAQELEKRLSRDISADILLINPTNYFVFSPLLMEAGTGSLQPRHAVVSLRAFLKNASFKMAQLEELDLQRQQIRVRLSHSDLEQTIPYDHLILALGSITMLPDVPGLREYGFELKSLVDAVSLRDRAIQMLELADAANDPQLTRRLLHFVVVGGNFTGTEVAGELHEYLRLACRLYRNLKPPDCQVTLLDIGKDILGPLGPKLGHYAVEKMRRRGIDVRLEETASAIEENRVMLRSGGALDASTVIWCAGVASRPLVQNLGLPTDKKGYVLCERDLRVQGHDNIWAIGDCAVNPGPDGRPYPATAQHAVAQGKHLAKNLVRVLKGQPTAACDIINKGALAPLGCRTGVARVFGIRVSGFSAWWLWRTVYLMKMPGWRRRLRVAIDWTLDLITRRDVVQLSLHHAHPAEETRELEDLIHV